MMSDEYSSSLEGKSYSAFEELADSLLLQKTSSCPVRKLIRERSNNKALKQQQQHHKHRRNSSDDCVNYFRSSPMPTFASNTPSTVNNSSSGGENFLSNLKLKKQAKMNSRTKTRARRWKFDWINDDNSNEISATNPGEVENEENSVYTFNHEDDHSFDQHSPAMAVSRDSSGGSSSTAPNNTVLVPPPIPLVGVSPTPLRITQRVDRACLVGPCQKKALSLASMNIASSEIPIHSILQSPLGPSLHKLSLADNKLISIPDQIVSNLPNLQILELQQCDLIALPTFWNLPSLKKLNLSHNRLVDFPDFNILSGIPNLKHLNLFGNEINCFTLPEKKVLCHLESLNLGYNNLTSLPPEMKLLTRLRSLKVNFNSITHIDHCIVEMPLNTLDATSNPLIQPPMETCERGIECMRRYYRCLKLEEVVKKKMSAGKPWKRRFRKREFWKLAAGKMLSEMNKWKEFEGMKDDCYCGTPLDQKKIEYKAAIEAYDGTPATAVMIEAAKKNPNFEQPSSPPSLVRAKTNSSSIYGPKLAQSVPSMKSAIRGPPAMLYKPKLKMSNTDQKDNVTSQLKDKAVDNMLNSSAPTLKGNNFKKNDDAMPRNVHLGSSLSDRQLVYEERKRQPLISRGQSLPIEQAHKEKEPMRPYSTNSSVLTESFSEFDEYEEEPLDNDEVTVNDTLKIIFVGQAAVGKTSIINKLIHGKKATIPTIDKRTVGVDIYDWDVKEGIPGEDLNLDTRVQIEDAYLKTRIHKDINIKFSVWDFAGQHVYHATHELFFSPRALYVIVWDMGANNPDTIRKKQERFVEQGPFKLVYDSSDDEGDLDDDYLSDEEVKRAESALNKDIDEKVQLWIDCIQSTNPGAAILPVATFDDCFAEDERKDEAKRRCTTMKQRLLEHEERRKQGIAKRLEHFYLGRQANTAAALRLRKLLCPLHRPKLIFADENDEHDLIRVSSTEYSGFDRLRRKIVEIATGREHPGFDFPIFRGHVGTRIPRLVLDVREVVRQMRSRFFVVEWGHFMNTLKENGIDKMEHISDALHFLTNVGELSYFGTTKSSKGMDYDDDEDVENILAIDQDVEQSTVNASGLSQFIFLNPRWLVAAVACILRHDLSTKIAETRRLVLGSDSTPTHCDEERQKYHAEMIINCPFISSEDACLLWENQRVTKKAANRAKEYASVSAPLTPFEFLQKLLVQFNVFVPIDWSVEKALLAGAEFGQFYETCNTQEGNTRFSNHDSESPKCFFLPSLLGPGEPTEAWTYKCGNESWKTTLCHSWLFPDFVPPWMMERITGSVLRDIYTVVKCGRENFLKEVTASSLLRSVESDNNVFNVDSDEGPLRCREILCWRTAFLLKIGMEVLNEHGEKVESLVEVFVHLTERDSPLCVASNSMGVGMRRLIVSGNGQVGDGGRKIWKGGYEIVLKAVERVMKYYGGLEFEKQGVCPECLARKKISDVSVWNWTYVQTAVKNGETCLRCKNGHSRVDTRLVSGLRIKPKQQTLNTEKYLLPLEQSVVPVTSLFSAVVLVGLWDGKTNRIVEVGSGFIVDRKRGLIVTAAHTVLNIWGEEGNFVPYGTEYKGLKLGKIVIGVIPPCSDPNFQGSRNSTSAVFRYFARILVKDKLISSDGKCEIDACVLSITTRLENDVIDSEKCGTEREILLMNDTETIKKENLQQLKISETCHLEESVRILGFNQGGEGLARPGSYLNQSADFAQGHVTYIFRSIHSNGAFDEKKKFIPREEIVVTGDRTIAGHSGGPCINQQGEVIGILSRSDPADRQRCYLVPTNCFKDMVKRAKKRFGSQNTEFINF